MPHPSNVHNQIKRFLAMKYGSRPICLLVTRLGAHTFKLGVLAWLFMTFVAHGGTKLWSGTINGNFSNGGNWVGGVAPAAGDDLFFQLGVAQLLVTNDF